MSYVRNTSLDLAWDEGSQSYIRSYVYHIKNVYLQNSCYSELSFLNTVNLHEVPFSSNSAANAFVNCVNLQAVSSVPNSITNMSGMFSGCNNLLTTPIIPDSVINMSRAFNGCSNISVPVAIPNSVTDISYAFENASSMTAIPAIPDSVTDAVYAFNGCSSATNCYSNCMNNVTDVTGTFQGTGLDTVTMNFPNTINSVNTFAQSTALRIATINAPKTTNTVNMFSGCVNLASATVIVPNTTNAYGMYNNCTSLTGNIFFNSANISNATNCFAGTSLTKTVYIPYEINDSGVATSTYNSFIAAGYGTEDYLHGVHLKDIDGSKITINPTPADATVLMFSEATGATVNLDQFTYTYSDANVEIQGLNTADTAIVVPSIWTETKGIRAIDGSKIRYKVFKEGYNTVESEITVDGSQTINVNLEQIMCTFTVVPMPADATVTFGPMDTQYYGWYNSNYGYRWTKTAYPKVGDALYRRSYSNPDYFLQVGAVNTIVTTGMRIKDDQGNQLDRSSNHDFKFTSYEYYSGTSSSIHQYGTAKFAIVPYGTSVSYTVSKAHYTTITGTEIVKTTGSKYIPLAIDRHTFTINATPADATVQILVNGKLANASSNDWTFTADNLNGDIELQTYTGSNTVVVMPTQYTCGNSVTADYGSTIGYKVSKELHKDVTGTLTLEQDTTLNINLGDAVNVADYEYTHENSVLTLTKYIGSGGDIEVPLIEEGA